MTKREARSALVTVGIVTRERGKKLEWREFPAEIIDRGLSKHVARLGGPDVAFACAVNGWTGEDKRRAAARKADKE